MKPVKQMKIRIMCEVKVNADGKHCAGCNMESGHMCRAFPVNGGWRNLRWDREGPIRCKPCRAFGPEPK